MSRDTRIVGGFLTAISALILGSSVATTWAIAEGASPKWRLLFRILCHGMPTRSLSLFGTKMPICARCTAIYAGLILATACFAIVPILKERAVRVFLFVAATPMAIDGFSQALRLRESTNPLRVGTGLAAAFAFGLWALCEIETQVRRRLAAS